MRGKNTIIINGKLYDAVSGLPLGAPDKQPVAQNAPAAKPAAKPTAKPHRVFSDIGPGATLYRAKSTGRPATPSKAAHRHVQKSTTLRRDVLKKPATTANHVGSLRKKPAVNHVARSTMISKFAPHPQPIPAKQAPIATPVKQAPKLPSQIAKAHQLVTPTKPVPQKALTSRALKEKLIAEKLAEAEAAHATPKKSFFSRQPRAVTIITSCFAILLLGGYLTYLNMPNLSVRVAAAQAGVAAKFPDYRPDGYRFNGPIAYTNGEVSIRFQANGSNASYTVREQSSSWDSQAVYDNLVAKKSDGSHITNSQNGLTVYTYKNNAAWVNGGILYTIEGDAPLSNEQLLRIAGSM